MQAALTTENMKTGSCRERRRVYTLHCAVTLDLLKSGFAYIATGRRESVKGNVREKERARAICCQERVTYTKLIQLFAVAVIVR